MSKNKKHTFAVSSLIVAGRLYNVECVAKTKQKHDYNNTAAEWKNLITILK